MIHCIMESTLDLRMSLTNTSTRYVWYSLVSANKLSFHYLFRMERLSVDTLFLASRLSAVIEPDSVSMRKGDSRIFLNCGISRYSGDEGRKKI